MLAVAGGLGFAIGILDKQVFTKTPPVYTLTESLFAALAGAVCFLLLHGWLLHHRGQTIGKWLLGIRIVDQRGDRVSLTRILVRRLLPVWVVVWIPYLGTALYLVDHLFIFNRQRMCLHDLMAGTIVVKVPRMGASTVDQLPA